MYNTLSFIIKFGKCFKRTYYQDCVNLYNYSQNKMTSFNNIPYSALSHKIKILEFLENFLLADYFLLIGIITLSLLLGIITYLNKFKTQVYLPIVVALTTFIVLKQIQKDYYNSSDEIFVVNLVIFLGLLFSGYIVFLSADSKNTNIRFEICVLLLLAFFGILLLLENSESLIIFVGLEIQAFTYYTLVSLADKNISSAEGALKYFLLGAMASGLFILGVSILYGVTGKTNFVEISEFANQNNSMMVLGSLFLLIGLLFKIGAVPFHLWLPDAYEGAPFYILLFLVSFPKLGLFYLIFNLNNLLDVHSLIVFSLILSAVLGSIQAVEQTKIKRFIAYTIIFNNAFFLSMVLLTGKNAFYGLMESLIFYIIITVTTVLTVLVLKNSENGQNMLSLRDLLSLKKNNFFLSLTVMTVFFSAAGIPPLLGFFQKYLILFNLIEQFQLFLAAFLILASILPAFYYIRMPKTVMFLPTSKQLLLASVPMYHANVIALGTALALFVFY